MDLASQIVSYSVNCAEASQAIKQSPGALDNLTTYCFQDDNYESPDVASRRSHASHYLIPNAEWLDESGLVSRKQLRGCQKSLFS
jgi:hypothetical protein